MFAVVSDGLVDSSPPGPVQEAAGNAAAADNHGGYHKQQRDQKCNKHTHCEYSEAMALIGI